jgi:hypothetical protein
MSGRSRTIHLKSDARMNPQLTPDSRRLRNGLEAQTKGCFGRSKPPSDIRTPDLAVSLAFGQIPHQVALARSEGWSGNSEGIPSTLRWAVV